MKAYNHCLRRGTKWYRKLAMEVMFGSALVNAFIVFKEVTQNKISITAFKKQSVLKLVQSRSSSPENSVMTNADEDHRLTEGKKNRCVVCYRNTKEELGRKGAQSRCPRSKYQCITCKKITVCHVSLLLIKL